MCLLLHWNEYFCTWTHAIGWNRLSKLYTQKLVLVWLYPWEMLFSKSSTCCCCCFFFIVNHTILYFFFLFDFAHAKHPQAYTNITNRLNKPESLKTMNNRNSHIAKEGRILKKNILTICNRFLCFVCCVVRVSFCMLRAYNLISLNKIEMKIVREYFEPVKAISVK